nr:MAG TPA: hypothetical protein [Caudoviricetes sp.]
MLLSFAADCPIYRIVTIKVPIALRSFQQLKRFIFS